MKQKQTGIYLCDQSLGKFVIRFHNEHRIDLQLCMNRTNTLDNNGHYRSLRMLSENLTPHTVTNIGFVTKPFSF